MPMSAKMTLRAFALLALLFSSVYATTNFVLINEGILPKKTVQKINAMGSEIYRKTGVHIYLVAVRKMPEKKIKDFEKELMKKLQSPYILLTFSLEDKKVDIVNSPQLQGKFDKEKILSPLPWSGAIIPLLTSHSKNKIAAVEAALLNGYAEIADEIASSYGIEFKESIGNVNKNIYTIMRALFYGIIALIALNFIYRRYIKK